MYLFKENIIIKLLQVFWRFLFSTHFIYQLSFYENSLMFNLDVWISTSHQYLIEQLMKSGCKYLIEIFGK